MFNTKQYSCILSSISSNQQQEFEIPTKCPHCNAFVQPRIICNSILTFNSNNSLLIISYKGDCCNKGFYATYSKFPSKIELLDIYPHTKPKVLPQNILELSPRFADLYNQSYTAEQNGHIELAGSGYRNAIEVLIKDFAIKKLQAPENEVCKMKLYEAIGTYLKEVNIDTSVADVIRVLGNDFTHYQRHYEDIDFIVVKKYLDIFIQQIETKLLIMEPIIPVKRSEPNNPS